MKVLVTEQTAFETEVAAIEAVDGSAAGGFKLTFDTWW
jgi:hypothetical protein